MYTSVVSGRSNLCVVTAFCALYAIVGCPVLASVNPPGLVVVVSVPLAAVLIALSVIDLRSFTLPDTLTIPLLLAGLLVAVLLQLRSPVWHVVAAVAGYGTLHVFSEVYYWLRKRDGIGMGDAKLFGAAGAWLGLSGLPTVLLWATGVAVAVVCVVSFFERSMKLSTAIPFGPFLAFAFWLVWLYGPLV